MLVFDNKKEQRKAVVVRAVSCIHTEAFVAAFDEHISLERCLHNEHEAIIAFLVVRWLEEDVVIGIELHMLFAGTLSAFRVVFTEVKVVAVGVAEVVEPLH